MLLHSLTKASRLLRQWLQICCHQFPPVHYVATWIPVIVRPWLALVPMAALNRSPAHRQAEGLASSSASSWAQRSRAGQCCTFS